MLEVALSEYGNRECESRQPSTKTPIQLHALPQGQLVGIEMDLVKSLAEFFRHKHDNPVPLNAVGKCWPCGSQSVKHR